MPVNLNVTTADVNVALDCQPADVFPPQNAAPDVDLCIFDPPYYDYIAYDELSAFYRAWRHEAQLSGSPLLPGKGNGTEPFGTYLGRCMRAIMARLRAGRPMAFTYHSANPKAWEAIGEALDAADLRVTAIWPVRSDGHMGHHSHDGNNEWDLVVVCRRGSEADPRQPSFTVKQWVEAVKPLKVRDADQASMSLAYDMISSRFGRIRRAH